jgi:hypothetical protein
MIGRGITDGPGLVVGRVLFCDLGPLSSSGGGPLTLVSSLNSHLRASLTFFHALRHPFFFYFLYAPDAAMHVVMSYMTDVSFFTTLLICLYLFFSPPS